MCDQGHFLVAQTGCVPAGDELAAGRRADGLNVVVLQPDALRRQLVQRGGLDGGVVVADVIETLQEENATPVNPILTAARLINFIHD